MRFGAIGWMNEGSVEGFLDYVSFDVGRFGRYTFSLQLPMIFISRLISRYFIHVLERDFKKYEEILYEN